jgi:pyruvate dehydrogenase E1 component alpha subunit
METVAGELYRGKKIRGFCHLYSGQEAVATGMNAAMDSEDAVTSAYRIHGWALLLGCSVKQIIGELVGAETGMSMGKGGSMHMYAPNFYGGNGIVGAQVPLAAGMALANKYLGNKTISVGLYGDGASNQGQVYEAYNMAKLWDLPALFVCENNHYGMGTSSERSSASNKYYTRGDYIPGIWVDGNDILAVREATAWARNYALTTGPLVMEMSTYRYHGHSMSDPDTTYRSREEKEAKRKTEDPIGILSARIVEAGWATEAELKTLEKGVRKAVKAEADEATASPEPRLPLASAHIYKGDQPATIRGCDITQTLYPGGEKMPTL